MSMLLMGEHLYIVLSAVLLSLAVGLPLGVAAYLCPMLRRPILWAADLFQTVPSLALLGVLMVVLGAGKATVVAGITLYSLLPIVRNTCLGLTEVEPALKEAARGCGMGRWAQLFRVELPLAFPVMFTGIRIAVINAIGTAVFAAFVGGGGLGSAIYQGIRTENMRLILLPTAALMVMALLFDTLLGRCEAYLKANAGRRSKVFPALAAGAVCVAMAAGSLAFGGSGGEGTLVMYDGNYSETRLLTHMVKLLVEEKTDLTVTVKDQMTQKNNFDELVAADPSCDLMVSYDGTLLTTFLHEDTTDIPEGMTLYDYVNRQAMERCGIRLLEKMGLNNTYTIAVPEKLAEEHGLKCISDLIPIAPQLVFGAEHDFFSLEGSMKYDPFTAFYGLEFQDAVSVDIGLKYTAAESGSFQVTVVYATDGMNRKAGLTVLEDDRSFFPEYNGALLVREEIFDKFAATAPQLEAVLNLLGGAFTNGSMTDLTYAVDVEGRSVEETARQFLLRAGLLSTETSPTP